LGAWSHEKPEAFFRFAKRFGADHAYLEAKIKEVGKSPGIFA